MANFRKYDKNKENRKLECNGGVTFLREEEHSFAKSRAGW